MSILVWSEKLSVGVKDLDDQHKKLIDMVNTFFDGLKSGGTNDLIKKTVPLLTSYVSKHFADEEKFMRQIGYTRLQSHQAKHGELTKKVDNLVSSINSGATVNALSVGQFLKDWLINHILQEDMQYAKFAASKATATK